MNIQQENNKIEQSIKSIAADLIESQEVDLIIGYTEGTVPLSSSPIFIKDKDDIDKLTWNNLCYVNLANYLIPPIMKTVDDNRVNANIGIVAKGCVARAILHLALEKQINLENIKIIGIECNGIINRRKIEKEFGEREITDITFTADKIKVEGKNFTENLPFDDYLNDLCKRCKVKSPPSVEGVSIVGASQEVLEVEDDYNDVVDFENKSPDERWVYIKDLLKVCTRCYACREACPLCYCDLCFVDQNLPTWFGKTPELNDIIVFHMIRALHLAGRCVACGACSSVCPMGIDLNIVTRKLEQIAKERFDFTSGINLETLPPMMSYSLNDKQEFMLEED